MRLRILLVFVFFAINASAQFDDSTLNILVSNRADSLRVYDLRLQKVAEKTIMSRDQRERINGSYLLAKGLIKALKVPGSYKYKFDSLAKYVSILHAPDNKFRIFTWSLRYDNDSFGFFGAIQMNNHDLILHGLYDKSCTMVAPDQLITDEKNWYGALYYRILKNKRLFGPTYYTLLGWDNHDSTSNRKIIDVLTFNEKKKPVFGAPIFLLKGNKPSMRVIFEFSNFAVMTVNYNQKEKAIVFDHMVPKDKSKAVKNNYTNYVPDGTYDYLKFKKGKWRLNKNLWKEIRNAPIQ